MDQERIRHLLESGEEPSYDEYGDWVSAAV